MCVTQDHLSLSLPFTSYIFPDLFFLEKSLFTCKKVKGVREGKVKKGRRGGLNPHTAQQPSSSSWCTRSISLRVTSGEILWTFPSPDVPGDDANFCRSQGGRETFSTFTIRIMNIMWMMIMKRGMDQKIYSPQFKVFLVKKDLRIRMKEKKRLFFWLPIIIFIISITIIN